MKKKVYNTPSVTSVAVDLDVMKITSPVSDQQATLAPAPVNRKTTDVF